MSIIPDASGNTPLPARTREGKILHPAPGAIGTTAEQIAIINSARQRPTAGQSRAAALAARVDVLERQLAALVAVVGTGGRGR